MTLAQLSTLQSCLISSFRSAITDAVWTLPFETAQDIIQGLRKQLAYLFMDALNYRKRFKTGNLPPQLSHLTGLPLQILLERPPFWEYQLFANTFADEIKRAKEHEWDLEYGIILGAGEYLQEPLEVMKWISKKMAESSRIVDSFNNLINTALSDALGPPGVTGDPIKLVYTSRRLGETYKAALDWAREAKQLSVPDEFQNLVLIVGRFLNKVRKQVDDFSHDILQKLNAGIAKGEAEGGQIVIEMNIVFELEGIDEFKEESNRVRLMAGLDPGRR
jgi:hypothetical protein